MIFCLLRGFRKSKTGLVDCMCGCVLCFLLSISTGNNHRIASWLCASFLLPTYTRKDSEQVQWLCASFPPHTSISRKLAHAWIHVFLPALRLSKLENTNACLPLFPLTQNQIPNKPFLLLMFSCRGPGVHNQEWTKKIMMGGFVLWLLLTLFTKNHRRLPCDFVSPSSDLNLSKI
jgi:hypothetical protein